MHPTQAQQAISSSDICCSRRSLGLLLKFACGQPTALFSQTYTCVHLKIPLIFCFMIIEKLIICRFVVMGNVQELPIETRKQRYGDVARKREAFYSHAELATFKRAWYWHDQPNDWNDCPTKGLIGRGCRSCDVIDERPSTQGMEVLSLVHDASLEDFTKWIWEG